MRSDLVHGGALDTLRAQFPNAPEPWLDLSTGINPWPYPNTDLSSQSWHRLPTKSDDRACRNAMATAFSADPETLLLSPGSELLIRLLPAVLPLQRLAILSPTYGDHMISWQSAKAQITAFNDLSGLPSNSDGVVIVNPNNPDGRTFELNEVLDIHAALVERGAWLIIDEAYADLNPDQSLASRAGIDNLIILRSFGKFFGLAGLRLGAIIAPKQVRDALSMHLGVWPVSGAALEIGARAYQDLAWQNATRSVLIEAAKRLDMILCEAGLNPVGGTVLFRYVETSDAHRIWQALAHHGIYVRRFDHSETHLRFGLPDSPLAEDRLRQALGLLA